MTTTSTGHSFRHRQGGDSHERQRLTITNIDNGTAGHGLLYSMDDNDTYILKRARQPKSA